MSLFPITSIYAALCGLLVLALAVRVAHIRRSQKIGIGDGGAVARLAAQAADDLIEGSWGESQ